MNPFAGHNYIAGLGLMAIGVTGFIGSIGGNLAPMIAALFAPQYLGASSKGQPTSNQSLATQLTNSILNLNPLTNNPITGPLGAVDKVLGIPQIGG